MPLTRSARLASGAITAGQLATAFTVPEGLTVIVKSLYGHSYSTAAHDVALRLSGPAAPLYYFYFRVQPQASFSWLPWIVLDQGDVMQLHNTGNSTINFWCSGAILNGVVEPLGQTKPV